MLYKNILVAFDGSEPAREALSVAKGLIGDDAEATMHVLSVVPLGALGIGNDISGLPTPAMQQLFPDMEAYEIAIDRAKSMAIENMRQALEELLDGVVCTVAPEAVVAAKPAEGICEYAAKANIDMIVMGRRGLGALRAMLGSVSYSVLQEANVPVVAVK